MFTKLCRREVSKVRHTVVDLCSQHPQLQSPEALVVGALLTNLIGANIDDRVGIVIVPGLAACTADCFMVFAGGNLLNIIAESPVINVTNLSSSGD